MTDRYAANLLVDSPAKRVVLAQEDTGIERQRKVRTALEALAEQPAAREVSFLFRITVRSDAQMVS